MSDYDAVAQAYAADNEKNYANACYERPATLALAGDVTGRRILDAGCGAGPLFAALRERGAVVSGVDVSAGMVEQARLRLGADADLRVADLGEPLPFPDSEFDDVIASLVLHYLQDWGPALAEVRRVLRTGGRLIVSVNHPTAGYCEERLAGGWPDYYSTYPSPARWPVGDGVVEVTFWNRPLHAMTDAFAAAGFRISSISEPPPLPEARDLFPGEFAHYAGAPNFLFFVLQAD
ncbi:class I SAM-dependent methyltransferase [Lentzea flaviverrucosa]|uniref:Methyltransferase domain-containing protein n=1 Tax=Lentzea flaviverrucosa TaxID=200379 RepID=A0A1H9D3H6_9PSEU|nr:class I SAM-dependent methyltransferase [Lentzea flaviverrucosa]RDI24736.1 methyltransferase family protein [Lentzea flaviverrucosa]SEQ08046.1 Methyltransferase domain-containing protein [Lentzea flaviverrucosa]